ncbi:MAG: alpha/beta hydrolase fold domain-containing protein [Methylobacteriaceae bacterium]|nr:alpha/beta hydrolase fold domain-containing protein [Methylobacteriaceae bacterium]
MIERWLLGRARIPRAMRLLASLLVSFCLAGPALAATPPAQPRSGPGSNANPDGEVVKRAVGTASAATYVYHLAGKAAEPRPVIVLLHAWGATNPMVYGGWIDHLARRGYLVLAPAFQEAGKTRPVDAGPIAATRLRDALAALAKDPNAQPNLSRLAYLGHSAGAGVAMYLAGAAEAEKLPVPKAVFAVMPGGIASDEKARGVQLRDLSRVDPSVAVVTLVGDKDFIASDRVSRRLLKETTNVPVGRKLFLRIGSDAHGFPSTSATLASPASPRETYDTAAIKLPPDPPVDPKAPRQPRPRWSADMVLSGEQQVLIQQMSRNPTDALDYYAFWKTFDMILDAAFGDRDMASLRADPTFADLGRWSDGWPMRRLSVEQPRPEPTATATPVAAAPAAPKPISATMPVTRARRQAH